MHQYDASNNTWIQLAKGPAWSYNAGFGQPQYYETLRTNVITINGEQRLIAMIRTGGFLDSYEYNPNMNVWKQLNGGPLWSDKVGYACLPCYKSIRTEVITVNGKQQLLAMILASGGLELHQYDPSNNTWIQLAHGPTTWSYPNGFGQPRYYETLRTNVITINGEQKLIAMIRTGGFLDSYEYNPNTNVWKQLNGGPLWSDNVGYACLPCYKSIRTEVITVNGKQQLLAMILASGGLELHQFDPDKNAWNQLVSNPAPAFIKSSSDSKYYETISTSVITVDRKEQLLVMMRGEQGIQFHQYNPSTAAWTEHQSHEAPIKNLNIAYGKTLSHIDQKEQARQAAKAEEQKRQAAIAEEQRRQAAIVQAEANYNLALAYYKSSQSSPTDRARWSNLVSVVQGCDMALAFNPGHSQASVLRNQVLGETGGRILNQANNSYVQYDDVIGNNSSSSSSANYGRGDRMSSNQNGFFSGNHAAEKGSYKCIGIEMGGRDYGTQCFKSSF